MKLVLKVCALFGCESLVTFLEKTKTVAICLNYMFREAMVLSSIRNKNARSGSQLAKSAAARGAAIGPCHSYHKEQEAYLYYVQARASMASAFQVCLASDASRVGFVDRLRGPVMDLASGIVGCTAPQAFGGLFLKGSMKALGGFLEGVL